MQSPKLADLLSSSSYHSLEKGEVKFAMLSPANVVVTISHQRNLSYLLRCLKISLVSPHHDKKEGTKNAVRVHTPQITPSPHKSEGDAKCEGEPMEKGKGEGQTSKRMETITLPFLYV